MNTLPSGARLEKNLWPFSEREIKPANLKSSWSVGRANEEAYKAGYSGRVSFRDWVKSKKLDDRSSGQLSQLGRSYEEGVLQEDKDQQQKALGKVKAHKSSSSSSVSVGEGDVEKEVASALKNYGAGAGQARDAAHEAMRGGGSFDAVFKRAMGMLRTKQNPKSKLDLYLDGLAEGRTSELTFDVRDYSQADKKRVEDAAKARGFHVSGDNKYILVRRGTGANPMGVGHWEEFDSEATAKKFARLMEGQGKKVTVFRKAVKVEENPRHPDTRLTQEQYDKAVDSFAQQFTKAGRGFGTTIQSARARIKKWTADGTHVVDLDFYKDAVNRYEQLYRSKQNPEPQSADMYESFHGRPSEQLVTFEEEEHYHEYLAELGVCCGVLVETVNGDVQAIGLSGFMWSGKGKNAGFVEEGQKSYQNPRRKKKGKTKGPFHQASDLILGGVGALDDKLGSVLSGNPNDAVGPNTTLLSSNEDGTQLYLVGGDQSLDLDALGIEGDMATKELVTIGDVCKIHYETEKSFDKFELIQYHHELGEETGDLPVLAYDRLNKRLLFIGGAYKIERPWGETSPGIEN